MHKNTGILIGVVALLVGLGGGYAAAVNRAPLAETGTLDRGHMMPDGTVMGGAGDSMHMSDTMASMNADLVGKTGDDFDRAFLAGMIVHHQGAVAMAEAALTQAKHPEIKDMAAAIIAAQNKEIGQMQAWQTSWYK